MSEQNIKLILEAAEEKVQEVLNELHEMGLPTYRINVLEHGPDYQVQIVKYVGK